MKKRIVITGATKGIGRALAEQLSTCGYDVVGLARGADASFPGKLIEVDLSDAAATSAALEEAVASGPVYGVVNNVGLVRPQFVDEVSLADMAAVLDLNLRPALQAVQAALPGMRAAGVGRIVNVSSLTVLGVVQRTSYAAAKAALVSFTRSWALELATSGITVNAIAPGPTETELFRANNPPGSQSEARYLASIPMSRLGKPDEIAGAIRFLISDEAAFMTGQTIFVDGGASIGKASL